MEYSYTCTDGKGNKIEISLPRIAFITIVAPQSTGYFFKVKFQAAQGEITIGEFVNQEDAVVEHDALEKAFVALANHSPFQG